MNQHEVNLLSNTVPHAFDLVADKMFENKLTFFCRPDVKNQTYHRVCLRRLGRGLHLHLRRGWATLPAVIRFPRPDKHQMLS